MFNLRNLDRSSSNYYVIAEIGNNHGGSIDICKELFVEAKLAGANAIKLQARDNKSLFTDKFFDSPYENPNAFGKTYGEHRENLELDRSELIDLNEFAIELGIDFICTAFDINSAVFIANDLDCKFFKLASSDLCNITLLNYFNDLPEEKQRPLILSTGGATFEDVEWTLDYIKDFKQTITILHCVSSYPAKHHLLNLKCIETLTEKYGDRCIVGYSSHDNGVSVPLIAATLGAKVIEKHFTLNRASKGTDHPMSANPTMLKNLVRDLKYLEQSLGTGIKVVHPEEKKPLRKMIKSPYFKNSLPVGTQLTVEHVRELIPFTGFTVRDLHNSFLGKTLVKSVVEQQEITPDCFSA